VRDRVREVANTVALDDNGTPVLTLEVRYYEAGHLFLSGYDEAGRVALVVACRDLAEAVVLSCDVVRRGRAKARRLMEQQRRYGARGRSMRGWVGRSAEA